MVFKSKKTRVHIAWLFVHADGTIYLLLAALFLASKQIDLYEVSPNIRLLENSRFIAHGKSKFMERLHGLCSFWKTMFNTSFRKIKVEWLKCKIPEVKLGVLFPLRPG